MCAWWHWLVYTRVGQVCIYLPTYERLLQASLLTTDNARYVGTYLLTHIHTCMHTHTHTFAGNRGPGACSVASKEALPTRANACLAPFHPRLFPPLTHLLTLRDGNSDRDDVHKPRRTKRDRNFMRRKRELYCNTCMYYTSLVWPACVRPARTDLRNAPQKRTMRKRVGGSALSPREIINYESFEDFFFRKDPGAPHQLHWIIVSEEKSCEFFSFSSK